MALGIVQRVRMDLGCVRLHVSHFAASLPSGARRCAPCSVGSGFPAPASEGEFRRAALAAFGHRLASASIARPLLEPGLASCGP